MPELGTSGSARGRDGQPPGLLDLQSYRKAVMDDAPDRFNPVVYPCVSA
jgi:hypothetical protein